MDSNKLQDVTNALSCQINTKSTLEQEASLLRESRKYLAHAKALNRKAKALSTGYLRSQTYERLNDFFVLAESVQAKQARSLHEPGGEL